MIPKIFFYVPSFQIAIGGAEVQAGRLAKEVQSKHKYQIYILSLSGVHFYRKDGSLTRAIKFNQKDTRSLFCRITHIKDVISYIIGNKDHDLLVHFHTLSPSALFIGLLLKIACLFHQNIVFVYKVTRTGCGSPLQQYLKPSLNFLLFKIQLLISSKFITVTPSGNQELLKLGVLPKNIFLIPNGIELPPKKNLLKWNDRKNVYVVIGRAIKRKRLTQIINAWLEADREKSAELFVIGDGPELLKLTGLYNTDLKQNNITFLGHLDQEDIMKILLEAKYYVSASISEGLSNSLLEAMAFGLVPIVRKMPENEFVIEHKNNGYFFSKEDDLCRLFSLKNKVEDENRISLNASSTIKKCFDIRITALKYKEAVEKLALKSRNKV